MDAAYHERGNMDSNFRDAERAELAAHLASVPDIDCEGCDGCANAATLPAHLADLLGDVTRDAERYQAASARYTKYTRQAQANGNDASAARWGAFADAYSETAARLYDYSDAIAHLCELARS